MAKAAGVEKEQALRDGGFTADEVQQWKDQTANDLSNAGFSGQEVNEYFGVKEPNMAPMKSFVTDNLKKLQEGRTPANNAAENLPGAVPVPLTPQPEAKDSQGKTHEALGLIDAIEAGFGMSVSGLLKHGALPETVLPEHAPMYMRIASQVGTMAGDLPFMAVGGVGGSAAGTAVAPGLGTAVGAGAGAMALPAAMRTALVQHYQNGDIKDFEDFWSRTSAVLLDAAKQGFIGGITAGAGGVAGKVLSGVAAPAAVKTGTVLASEVATMTTLGKALEGQTPNASDFLEAAIMVGGLHAAGYVGGKLSKTDQATAEKLQNIYAQTGIKPEQVVEHAMKDPTVKTDLLSPDIAMPKAYEPFIEKTDNNPFAQPELQTKPVQIDEAPHASLNPEFGKPAELQIKQTPKEEKVAPPEPPTRPQEVQNVLDRVKPSAEKEGRSLTWDEFYTKAVDDLHPLKQLTRMMNGEKPLPVKDDPYALARLTRGSFGKADQFLEYSPFKFESLENTGSKPLKQILEPFKEDLDGFRAYAVASRTVELSERGIETGVPVEDAKFVVKNGKGKFDKGFRDLVKYQNDTLQYLKDSGVLSDRAFEAAAEANKSYVPFFRLTDEGGQKTAGTGLRVHNPIKKIQGSQREIIDPLESIVKNTYLYVTLAERNRAMVKMAELAESSPSGEALMQKVPQAMQRIEVKGTEIQHLLDEHGIDAKAEDFAIFRPKSMKLAPDQVAVYREGKREIYQVAPEVAEAAKALDRDSMGLFTKILAYPAKLLRAGSVIAPEFISRNLMRDQMTAFNLAEGAFTPLHTLSGLGSLFRKDEVYQAWLKSGGANSAMVSIDRSYIEQNVFKLSKETGLIDKTWNVMKSPIEMLRVTSELIENATRLGEFKRVTNGDLSAENIFKAGLSSREITLDFQRIGAQTRAMNSITAFWNAQVQGLDKAARTLKERPLETGAKITASITIPSVLLWYANKDDPRWDEIPRWQKDLFWIVMTKDTIYRIPKPTELGVLFGSIPERALEAFSKDNPRAFNDLSDTLLQGFSPGYVPTFAQPILEQWANKSTFTGHTIVPHYLEKVLPEYQYTDYTSESAKLLGKFAATVPGLKQSQASSPQVIENYMRSWSGNMGRYALSIADTLLTKSGAVPDPVKPASTLADMPVIRAFVVRYPSASAQSIQDFHDRYAEKAKVFDTIHYLAKSGDFQNAMKEMTLQENQDKLFKLQGVQEALGTQQRFISFVYKNKDMTPNDKRQLIDGIYFFMIKEAQMGNQVMDEVEKSFKEKK